MALPVDEAELLKAYHLDSLEPLRWHSTEMEADDAGRIIDLLEMPTGPGAK